MRTSELIDITLDWAVSYALGHNPMKDFHSHGMTWNGWWETTSYINTKPNEYRRIPRYSIDWEYGGPIIERESITLRTNACIPGYWAAFIDFGGSNTNTKARQFAATPLVAAMRCYVASKLGDEVEIPEELQDVR